MGESAARPDNGIYQLLDLQLDLAVQTVKRDGEAIVLPDLSFRLLAALVRCAPETIGKDELVREVWGEVVVSDETLSQRVRLLRQALGEDAQDPRYISAVRGRGYRLICPVKPAVAFAQGPARNKLWLAGAAVVLVLAVSLAMTNWLPMSGREEGVSAPGIQSIAVLPFTDLSPDKDHAYFADGMQDELLTRLSRLEGLEVASRTSVEQYRTTAMALPEIAQELGVGAVIESSVRVADNHVRITVQLIHAQTDRHLWAEMYDRDLSVENIFSIQQEVAERIAEALALEYKSSRPVLDRQLPTSSMAAYDAYLLGRAHTFIQTPHDLELAIELLEQAVAIDPEFAQAWAVLGLAYSFTGTLYGGKPPREVYPKAKQAVTRALSIDNELIEARSLYGDILSWYDWDFIAAEREYLKAMALNPDGLLSYVLFLSTQRRHEEAITLLEQIIAAHPNDAWVHVNAGWTFLRVQQYERAIQEARLASGHSDALPILGYGYLGLEQFDQAVSAFETNLRVQGRQPRLLSHLAMAYFAADRVTEGQQLLDELTSIAAIEYVPPELIADVYFAAGDIDNGFAAMEQAVEVRSRGAMFLLTTQSLDGHRQDPRYLALVNAVGF
jgi:TolB-like protein/DNA-binding winged helix-turn-helix (wHTH) protein/Tfp pilus assembly protein PilF